MIASSAMLPNSHCMLAHDNGRANGKSMVKEVTMDDRASSKPPRRRRGRPFEQGRSGNPAGRRTGSRNKATLAAAALLQGEAEALTRKAVELALVGDPTALRLCLERILPAHKVLECPPSQDYAEAVASKVMSEHK